MRQLSPWLVIVVSLAVAYLAGGVPFGVVVSRAYKVDITKEGSGNTGATNVFRSLGWWPALVVVLGDVTKGAAPAALAIWLSVGWQQWHSDLLVITVGVAAMAGHMYSPYFKLRGGKGVATGAGVILALMPWVFLTLLAVFIVLVAVTRLVSLASLTIALALPVMIWAYYPDRPVLLLFAAGAVPLVYWAHRTNIVRLVRREEPRVTMGHVSKGRDEGDRA